MGKRPTGLNLITIWLFFAEYLTVEPLLRLLQGSERAASALAFGGIGFGLILMVWLRRLHPAARWAAIGFFALRIPLGVWEVLALRPPGVFLMALVFDILALKYLAQPLDTELWLKTRSQERAGG